MALKPYEAAPHTRFGLPSSRPDRGSRGSAGEAGGGVHLGRLVSRGGGGQRSARPERAGNHGLYPVIASREGGLCPTSLEMFLSRAAAENHHGRAAAGFSDVIARV